MEQEKKDQSKGCPYHEGKLSEELKKNLEKSLERNSKKDNDSFAPSSTEPKLMKISEVDKKYDANSPMSRIVEWIHNFLANPHPELGRKGPVCPFVPKSLELNSIWMVEMSEEDLSLERICEIITSYRDLFLTTEPTSGPNAMNKAFLVVFPSLGSEASSMIDEVQQKLMKYFVDMGLMLGEFHSMNQSPGLHNPNFKPLRSPIPMLGIRHMADTDLPFLLRSDSATNRAVFLRSYLTCLRENIAPARFDHALDSLIEAEIQKWNSKTMMDEQPDLANLAEA